MPTYLPTIEASAAVAEFVLLEELLTTSAPSSPLYRFIEYQAYAELVRLAASEDLLPEDHGVSTLDVASIRDWIRDGKNLSINFKEKIKSLLIAMQAAGSRGFDEICDFYCRYTKKLDAGFTGASLLLSNPELAALIAQYKFDILLFHGIPLTSLLVIAIKAGILDDICDCKNRVL